MTQSMAPRESKRIRWERAVRAKDPEALQRVYAATIMWQMHHQNLVFCSLDMLFRHSLRVGTGREFGSAMGARGVGSKII